MSATWAETTCRRKAGTWGRLPYFFDKVTVLIYALCMRVLPSIAVGSLRKEKGVKSGDRGRSGGVLV
jgi:hypothetical protein